MNGANKESQRAYTKIRKDKNGDNQSSYSVSPKSTLHSSNFLSVGRTQMFERMGHMELVHF
mgnify:CR=1 FL=1